ncbi:MAG: hypothetical protein PHR52_05290 [Fermentimonas sp.]|nr:hypothetical protein [Fermentimonas sp.]
MALRVDRMQLQMAIDNDPARKKIHEIDKQIANLNKGLKGLHKNSTEYANTKDKIKELRMEQDKVRDSIGISNMSMRELVKTQKSLNVILRQLRPGTKEYEDLEKQVAEVDTRIKELRNNSRETQKQLEKPLGGKGGFLTVLKGVFAGNLLTKGAMMLADLAGKAREFVREGVEMAAAAQGIEHAFNRIANRDYLNDLRRQTRGLVSDFTLMQSAVRAENFDIPLTQLGTLLQFAQNRARDTGESVEYLTQSIIDGIGRKSPLILDNLGISVVRIQEEVKKTGDFATAVGNIVEDEMSKAGEVIDTAADAATRKKVAWENLQLAVGNFFVNFKSGWDGFTTRFAEGLTRLIQGQEEFSKQFEDQIKKVADLNMNLPNLIDRYEELRGKAELNKDEQRELNEVIGKLNDAVPSAAIEFDKYGNVLAISTAKVREFIAAETAKLEVMNRSAIAEETKNLEDYREELDLVLETRQRGTEKRYRWGTEEDVVLSDDQLKDLDKRSAELEKLILGTETYLNEITGKSAAERVQQRESELKQEAQFNKMGERELKKWIEMNRDTANEYLVIAQKVYNNRFANVDPDGQDNEKKTTTKAADPFKEELDALKRAQQEELLVLKQSLLAKDVTEEEFREISFQKEIEHLEKMKLLYEMYDQDTVDLEIQLTDKLIAESNRRYKIIEDLKKQHADKLKNRPREEALEENDDAWEAVSYKDKKAVLDVQLKNEMMTEEEHQKALFKLRVEYLERFLEKYEGTLQGIQNISSDLSGAMSNFQRSEEMAVERKYNKMIDAAGKNSKQVAKLEEEKEKKLNDIRAKYADKQFIVTVAQVISSTAVSAMEAFKAMAGIPIVGPALGGIAAAAAVAFGASQIAVAKQQRDAAKAGYRSGGYTGTGKDDEEAGVVHRNEFVNTADAVRNPHVKRFLDVFNVAQKDGTIRMLNTSQILERARLDAASPAKQAVYSEPTPTNDLALLETLNRFNTTMNRLTEKLDDPIPAYTVIHGQNGSRKRNDMYDRIMKNARLG